MTAKRRRAAAANLNLKGLIDGTGPNIPPEEMTALLDRVKTFAKRVHRSMSHGRQQKSPDGVSHLETSMPPEVAQVVYDLAGALALSRCGTRIIGLSDDRFRKNLAWALDQSWIDGKLRAVFRSALKRLDVKSHFLSKGKCYTFFLPVRGENQRSVAIAVIPDVSITTNSHKSAHGPFRSSHFAIASDPARGGFRPASSSRTDMLTQ